MPPRTPADDLEGCTLRLTPSFQGFFNIGYRVHGKHQGVVITAIRERVLGCHTQRFWMCGGEATTHSHGKLLCPVFLWISQDPIRIIEACDISRECIDNAGPSAVVTIKIEVAHVPILRVYREAKTASHLVNSSMSVAPIA
jgi:hypothetical protein